MSKKTWVPAYINAYNASFASLTNTPGFNLINQIANNVPVQIDSGVFSHAISELSLFYGVNYKPSEISFLLGNFMLKVEFLLSQVNKYKGININGFVSDLLNNPTMRSMCFVPPLAPPVNSTRPRISKYPNRRMSIQNRPARLPIRRLNLVTANIFEYPIDLAPALY